MLLFFYPFVNQMQSLNIYIEIYIYLSWSTMLTGGRLENGLVCGGQKCAHEVFFEECTHLILFDIFTLVT